MTIVWWRRGASRASAVVGVVALLLGGLAVAGPASAAASVAPWYMSDFNAAHSRANTLESTLTPATVSRVVHRRTITATARGFNCAPSPSGPITGLVEVGGDTYTVANNVITSANTRTGAVAWRTVVGNDLGVHYDVGIGYSSGLVIVGGVDCGSVSDPLGSLVALNAVTGAVAWQRGFEEGLGDFVISAGRIIATGAMEAGGSGMVSAWRVGDGTLLWQRGCCGTNGRVAVVGGVVITTGARANTAGLRGLSLATGAVRWTVNGFWRLQAGDLSGSRGHSVLVTTSHGRLDEFDPVTGAFVGPYPRTARNVLAVDASRVYATCVSATISAGVCAYSRSTRAQVWIRADASSLAAIGGAVLYLADGKALKSATGATLKRLWTGTAGYLVEADSFVLAGAGSRVRVYGL